VEEEEEEKEGEEEAEESSRGAGVLKEGVRQFMPELLRFV